MFVKFSVGVSDDQMMLCSKIIDNWANFVQCNRCNRLFLFATRCICTCNSV